MVRKCIYKLCAEDSSTTTTHFMKLETFKSSKLKNNAHKQTLITNTRILYLNITSLNNKKFDKKLEISTSICIFQKFVLWRITRLS